MTRTALSLALTLFILPACVAHAADSLMTVEQAELELDAAAALWDLEAAYVPGRRPEIEAAYAKAENALYDRLCSTDSAFGPQRCARIRPLLKRRSHGYDPSSRTTAAIVGIDRKVKGQLEIEGRELAEKLAGLSVLAHERLGPGPIRVGPTTWAGAGEAGDFGAFVAWSLESALAVGAKPGAKATAAPLAIEIVATEG